MAFETLISRQLQNIKVNHKNLEVLMVLTYKNGFFIWLNPKIRNYQKLWNCLLYCIQVSTLTQNSQKVEPKRISIHYFNRTESNSGSVVHQDNIAIVVANGVGHWRHKD